MSYRISKAVTVGLSKLFLSLNVALIIVVQVMDEERRPLDTI